MSDEPSREDLLLAVALGSANQQERRVHPDRRSGIERRRQVVAVQDERRSGGDRRRVARRRADLEQGPTLLEKARARLRALHQRRP